MAPRTITAGQVATLVADIGSDIIDLGGPGQEVGRGLELEAGVSFDQRGELQVLLGASSKKHAFPPDAGAMDNCKLGALIWNLDW